MRVLSKRPGKTGLVRWLVLYFLSGKVFWFSCLQHFLNTYGFTENRLKTNFPRIGYSKGQSIQSSDATVGTGITENISRKDLKRVPGRVSQETNNCRPGQNGEVEEGLSS